MMQRVRRQEGNKKTEEGDGCRRTEIWEVGGGLLSDCKQKKTAPCPNQSIRSAFIKTGLCFLYCLAYLYNVLIYFYFCLIDIS